MPERLTDEQLDELLRLCAEATRSDRGGLVRRCGLHEDYAVELAECDCPDCVFERDVAEAELSVAARDALPALIAEVRALRRVAEAAERAAEDIRQSGIYGGVFQGGPTGIVALFAALAEWRRVREEIR